MLKSGTEQHHSVSTFGNYRPFRFALKRAVDDYEIVGRRRKEKAFQSFRVDRERYKEMKEREGGRGCDGPVSKSISGLKKEREMKMSETYLRYWSEELHGGQCRRGGGRLGVHP